MKTVDFFLYYQILTSLQAFQNILLERTQGKSLFHLFSRFQRNFGEERTHIDSTHQVTQVSFDPNRLSRLQYSFFGARPTIEWSFCLDSSLPVDYSWSSLWSWVPFFEVFDLLYLLLIVRNEELPMLSQIVWILIFEGHLLLKHILDGTPRLLPTWWLGLTVEPQLGIGFWCNHSLLCL